MKDGEFNQAFASLARRENLPASLTSAEWESVPSEIRERAFFMARVSDAEILEGFRGQVDKATRGDAGTSQAMKEIAMWLEKIGYKPPEGKAGSLQDLSSIRRMAVVLRTNMDMASGHAHWVRSQTAIRSYPAQRFVRVSPREEPRDWETRWAQAKAATVGVPGVHPTEKVALLNHPIWVALSRFSQPWPPFDFMSGMGVRRVGRAEALSLGFDLNPENNPLLRPVLKSINEGLEVTPNVENPEIRKSLSETIARFGEWDGSKLVFTDPDGTKRYTAARLAEIWSRPAPKGYDRLTQKDALDGWDGGVTPDKPEARVALRKLFGRIDNTGELPREMWHGFRLADADALSFIKALYQRRFMIPANVAGWDFTGSIRESERLIDALGDGWRVSVLVDNARRAVDISALRPGKPGYVFVAGTEFRVKIFGHDRETRRINIILEEVDP